MYVPHKRVSSSLGLVFGLYACICAHAHRYAAIEGLGFGWGYMFTAFHPSSCVRHVLPPPAPSPLRLKTLGTLSSCAHLALRFLPIRIHSYYTTFQGAVGAIANLGVGVAALDDKALDDPVEGLRHTRGRQGV